MTDPKPLFDEHAPMLLGLAYRMTGSAADAEDIVQEARVRFWQRGDDVTTPRAWLAKTVTHLCLDHLKSARVRRETYVGTWLPEPVSTSAGPFVGDAGAVTLAFLTLLEEVPPTERAAFVLVELCGHTPSEAARILEKTPEAVRQLVHRARARLKKGDARGVVDPHPALAHVDLFARLGDALARSDHQALLALLAPDVVVKSDGGGKVKAALNVVESREKVARLLVGLWKKQPPNATFSLAPGNGGVALVGVEDGRVTSVQQLVIESGQITALLVVTNPDKLLIFERDVTLGSAISSPS